MRAFSAFRITIGPLASLRMTKMRFFLKYDKGMILSAGKQMDDSFYRIKRFYNKCWGV